MSALRARIAGRHLLTCCADDIFRVDAIAQSCTENGKRAKIVIVLSRFSDALVEHATGFPNLSRMDHDHAVEFGPTGVPSLTGPGAAPLATAILGALGNEQAETLLIHRDRLRADPERELDRIEAFVGLTLDRDVTVDLQAGLAVMPLPQRAAAMTPAAAQVRIARAMRLAPRLGKFIRRYEAEAIRDAGDGIQDADLDETPGTIVGFYTKGTIYEEEARRLEASIDALGLPAFLLAVADRGDWLENVRIKPGILRELRQNLSGPLLYVDVDAVFHANPWPVLRANTHDVAYCVMRDGLARSGTVLLNDTAGARMFLDDWANELAMHPHEWDQHPLTRMLVANGTAETLRYSIGLLSVDLCYVFDRDKASLCFPPAKPVIEHLQASRETAERAESEGGQERLRRRRRRLAQLDVGGPDRLF